jgi:hypothetical protein
VLLASPPHPRRLRAVGWSIMAASLATLGLLAPAML